MKTATTAQMRLLLDAPEQPPAADLDSGVAETLGLRAGLMADLLATDSIRAEIARGSGIAPAELAMLPPASAAPSLPVTLAVAATEAARATTEPYALAIAADHTIPIVSFPVDGAGLRAAPGAPRPPRRPTRLVATRPAKPARLCVAQLGLIRTIAAVDRLVRPSASPAIVVFSSGPSRSFCWPACGAPGSAPAAAPRMAC